MQIKKVILNNIRSYVNETIVFPEDKVLLSGDIGTGKSSVLLAIEFALFGLIRGNLNGNTLLRNGTDSGSVELYLKINNKEIIIHRKLKRTNKSITQDTGYIIVNNEKKIGTAIELKQKILELLNYPPELLTKNKSLIYRYTVYTPQEQMKHILFCNEDERLETLRKVFGIDKYKRIVNNIKFVSNNLREKKKYLKGQIIDLNPKIEQFKHIKTELNTYEEKFKEIKPICQNNENQVNTLIKNVNKIEQEVNKLKKIEYEINILDNSLKTKIIQNKRIEQEIKEINEEIPIEKIKEIKSTEHFKKEILELQTKKINLEKTLEEIIKKISHFQTLCNTSENMKKEIEKLDFCPTCKQNVTSNHKNQVIEKAKEKMDEENKKIILFQEKQKIIQKEITDINNNIEMINKNKQNLEIENIKLKRIKEMFNRKNKLIDEQNRLKKEIGEHNIQINNNYKILESLKDIKNIYEKTKKDLEISRSNLRYIELKKKEIEIKLFNLKQNYLQLQKEIESKKRAHEKLKEINYLYDWLNKHFTELVTIMEKNILLKIHSEFNSHLEKWFSILINEDKFSINLDETFSINIEQNGYNLEYENLSGGEKTAAALAYRLALNQVINNLVNTINTRNLIILDEPTDGFSDKQLDNMHLLLNEINAKQIILVSHEKKIESFVNNIINFTKKEHVSSTYT